MSVEAPAPTNCCGYVPFAPGATWGYLNGAAGPGLCVHVIGERRCECCSETWWRAGNDDTHDYDLVGDPPEYHGGAAKEDCPACVEWRASQRPKLAPLTPAGPDESLSAAIASIVQGYSRAIVRTESERFEALTVVETGGVP